MPQTELLLACQASLLAEAITTINLITKTNTISKSITATVIAIKTTITAADIIIVITARAIIKVIDQKVITMAIMGKAIARVTATGITKATTKAIAQVKQLNVTAVHLVEIANSH